MLNETDERVLRHLESDLPRSLTRHAFAVRARAENIRWRTVLVLAGSTAVLTFVTGLVAGDGALGCLGFLAVCALGFFHAWRTKRFAAPPQE
ncbi:hypothetical protein GCM10022222_33090 [Amycolatopsis ultiminotia]|uniref:DUF3040 domain-containing protein n=1 Tax=Amycolatopsis ultiminotia TaxID=543629 RepID=A0ABP6W7T5_9PSEU